jgi:hypothetical protein
MRQKIFFLKRFVSKLLYVQGQYGDSFRGIPLLCPCQQTIRNISTFLEHVRVK